MALIDQLTVTGGGSASPGLVQIPGMYAATDPGILIDIYESLSTYIDPGPTVYSGGTTKSCGAGCTGVESGTATGASFAPTGAAGTTVKAATTTAAAGSTLKTSASSAAAATSPASGCTAAKYAQCGGTGYTGCTTCAVCASSLSVLNIKTRLCKFPVSLRWQRSSLPLSICHLAVIPL